jgi:hypothetical protein
VRRERQVRGRMIGDRYKLKYDIFLFLSISNISRGFS